MSDDGWHATISVRTPHASWSAWLEAALAPEATREVPRARARVERRGPDTLEIVIEANDSGAVRAAVNTYLGWIDLSLATARAAAAAPPRPPA
ncbi:MAG TPA: KEOPS complex subunit Pcc1 [Thermoplasmata archaeon]|nr:KEOPS complex subunit Pcc1 [Thermoplasmata archaeon]